MKPKFCASLAVAHAVLNRVDVPEAALKRVCVLGYENGREHGCALRVYPEHDQQATICWAENRGSDDIVVYVGRPGELFGDANVGGRTGAKLSHQLKGRGGGKARNAVHRAGNPPPRSASGFATGRPGRPSRLA